MSLNDEIVHRINDNDNNNNHFIIILLFCIVVNRINGVELIWINIKDLMSVPVTHDGS